MKHASPIPNRLRKYRKIMGYTQRDVAKLLHVTSASRISQWENGARLPSIRNLIKLSVLYRTLIDHLYYDLRQAILNEFAQSSENASDSSNKIKNRPP